MIYTRVDILHYLITHIYIHQSWLPVQFTYDDSGIQWETTILYELNKVKVFSMLASTIFIHVILLSYNYLIFISVTSCMVVQNYEFKQFQNLTFLNGMYIIDQWFWSLWCYIILKDEIQLEELYKPFEKEISFEKTIWNALDTNALESLDPCFTYLIKINFPTFFRVDTTTFAETVRNYNKMEPFTFNVKPILLTRKGLRGLSIYIPIAAAHLYDSVVLYAKVSNVGLISMWEIWYISI